MHFLWRLQVVTRTGQEIPLFEGKLYSKAHIGSAVVLWSFAINLHTTWQNLQFMFEKYYSRWILISHNVLFFHHRDSPVTHLNIPPYFFTLSILFFWCHRRLSSVFRHSRIRFKYFTAIFFLFHF